MRILIVTGMPGSGKEELLNVAVSMGIPFLRMGDIVREHHARSGTDLSVGAYAGRERELHGTDVWARRAIERMHGTVFLVDGCRSMAEVEAFKGLSPDVMVVAVHASRATRYRRLVERGREDAPADTGEFDARDKREIGWGIAEVISLADILIVNESDLESFRGSVRNVLEGLL